MYSRAFKAYLQSQTDHDNDRCAIRDMLRQTIAQFTQALMPFMIRRLKSTPWSRYPCCPTPTPIVKDIALELTREARRILVDQSVKITSNLREQQTKRLRDWDALPLKERKNQPRPINLTESSINSSTRHVVQDGLFLALNLLES